MTKAERQKRIAALRRDIPRITHKQLAEDMGVSVKTIQRDIEEMEAEGLLPDETTRIAQTQAARDAYFEANQSTYAMIDEAIRRTNAAQQALHDELGFNSDECPCCGRKNIKLDKQAFMLHQAYYAGGKTLNDQITTRAKLLGELIENHVIVVSQIDQDVTDIMGEIAAIKTLIPEHAALLPDGSIDVSAVTRALALRIYNKLVAQSVRRAKRLPPATDIIQGTYRLLPEGGQSEEESA